MIFKNKDYEETPINELPKRIVEYYLSHDYGKKGIPLSADTCQAIKAILDRAGDSDA